MILVGLFFIFDPVIVHDWWPVKSDTEKAGKGVDIVCEAFFLIVIEDVLPIPQARRERQAICGEIGDIFTLLVIIPDHSGFLQWS